MRGKHLQERVEALEAEAEEEGVIYAVVQNGQVTVTDTPASRCNDEYHRAVIGVDGVARVLAPAGRSLSVKPCQKCSPRPSA